MKKISLLLVLTGLGLIFTPIWFGPAELMPVGVAALVAGFLLFNKARTGSFFPGSYSGHDYHDRFDRDDDGGFSGDWDDSDTD